MNISNKLLLLMTLGIAMAGMTSCKTTLPERTAATVSAESALASAPLPKELISLESAHECASKFMFNEWGQIVRVFRWKGAALKEWQDREKRWAKMKAETADGDRSRTWLLSGLSAGQQKYWAQWTFYRTRILVLDLANADKKVQQQCWDAAEAFATRQMKRDYVNEDPYLSEISEERDKYYAETERFLQ